MPENALETASKMVANLRTDWRATDLLNIIDLLLTHVDLLERKVAVLEKGKAE